MNFTTNTLKINMMLNYCLLILTAKSMRLKRKMFNKILMKTRICLILVTIHEIQSSLAEVIGKMKDEFKGKIITEFVGLKSKIRSLIDVDDKEITKAKGVNKK